MRLDKFLKVSRIVKRRTVAKEIADQGRVKVNGQVAKSSTNVEEGDQLALTFGNKLLTVEIEEILESTKKEDAEKMYRVLSEEFKNE